jgi:hypothetical protein
MQIKCETKVRFVKPCESEGESPSSLGGRSVCSEFKVKTENGKV